MRTVGAAAAALALAVACGCAATSYRPTEPRPVMGPGVLVDVMSIRGAGHEAEVSIRTQQSTLIGPVSWSTGDKESCSSPQPLPIDRHPEKDVTDPVPDAFEVNGADVVFVGLASGS